MLPLKQLFELAKNIQQGIPAPMLECTESPTFDAAWAAYTNQTRTPKNASYYKNIWESARAFVDTSGIATITVETTKTVSNYVAVSYITAAHYVMEIVQDSAPHRLHHELQEELRSKILFIDQIAKRVTVNLAERVATYPKSNTVLTADDPLRFVLGEFYSLCVYAQRELHATLPNKATFGTMDYQKAMNHLGLPLFLNREDRLRQEAVGKDVHVLPVRPGMQLNNVANEHDATVLRIDTPIKRVRREP